ncbi:hypothetical protein BDF19DRAFT_452084 [Syncephalis fuscata]|nr:hypothetical protein BDF19DRAFT_452084 [Syncephalis fuscata]
MTKSDSSVSATHSHSQSSSKYTLKADPAVVETKDLENDSTLDSTDFIDHLMNPRNAAIATGLLLTISAGASALLLRRGPSVKAAQLPKHFKQIHVPTATPTNYSHTKTANTDELEPFSPEARRVGRWLAIKALLAGSALCLTVSSAAAWVVGRALGVHNVSKKILIDTSLFINKPTIS